jgi:AcrR family transcriptional regulator
MAQARAPRNPRKTAAKPKRSEAAEPVPPERLSPREARRRQRIELGREQILDTAEQLFGERGYHDTGLKDVGERCEFSVGTIYTFFDSKDALYAAVLMRRGVDQITEMRRVAAAAGPAGERLIAMARLQIEQFRRYPAWGRLTTRVLTLGFGRETTLPEEFRRAYRDAIDLEAGLIAAGQREGTIRAGAPHALARLFSSMVTAFHGMDPETSDDAEDLAVEEFLAIVAQTFAPPPVR